MAADTPQIFVAGQRRGGTDAVLVWQPRQVGTSTSGTTPAWEASPARLGATDLASAPVVDGLLGAEAVLLGLVTGTSMLLVYDRHHDPPFFFGSLGIALPKKLTTAYSTQRSKEG